MPFSLQIIRSSDFVRLNGKGEYDQEETRRALMSIAIVCLQSNVDCALLDVRNARTDMHMDDLHELALALKQIGFLKKHRLAILHRPIAGERAELLAMRSGEGAEFFAMFASEFGWNVKAFDDFEKAMEWLGTIPPAG